MIYSTTLKVLVRLLETLAFLIREFARPQQKSPHYRSYRRLLRLEEVMFVIGIGLFVFTMGVAPMGEMLPALGFHAWIIYVTLRSNQTLGDNIHQKPRAAA